jgi:predicted AAA+ superfamily ATPase
MYYKRQIEDTIRSISNTYPVLFLTGARQVGKTTLLKHIAEENRQYISLDNPTYRRLAKEDPALFLQRFAPPIIIDEAQYAPELFEYIKIHADEHKENGAFWLTGSQAFHMMKNVTESLAGRVGVVHIYGLSGSELSGRFTPEFEMEPKLLRERMASAKPMSLPDVFERIYKGSMPKLYEDPNVDRDGYFESYLETYVSRDIRDLTQVADDLTFQNFVRVVAARTATNVNYETLAQEVGITSPTAKRWLSVMVSSGLVLLIQPYFNNALKRTIKAPRMYFADTGLCAHLLAMPSAKTLERSFMSAAFFETWVVSEVYKSYINNGKRPSLYFYRDQNKKEIDLIIMSGDTIYPIEIKKASDPSGATKNFSVLKPIEKASESAGEYFDASHLKTKIGTGGVICLAPDILPIDQNNWYIPAWII